MALTGSQVAQLAVAIYETPAYTATVATDLDASVEALIITKLAAYVQADSYVRLKGKAEFNEDWDRAGIRGELRTLLGLDPIAALDPHYEGLSIFELEVGSQF